jgi:hypothetical protein
MKSVILGAGVLALLSGVAQATPQDDATAPIGAFVAAFDKGDLKTAAAQLSDSPTIIDEVAPYSWTGPKALGGWAHDLLAGDAKAGINGESVSISPASRVGSVRVQGPRRADERDRPDDLRPAKERRWLEDRCVDMDRAPGHAGALAGLGLGRRWRSAAAKKSNYTP